MNKKLKAMFAVFGAVAIMVILMLVPAACSSSTPPNTVDMINLTYSPATLTVSVGTTVTWRNKSDVQHSVTSDTGLFDSGLFNPGGTYTHTFSTAGTFPYHCTIHPGMVGTIIVQ